MLLSAQSICVSTSPPDINLGLAVRLKQARASASLSQIELADQLGVSERSIQMWEAGTIPQPRHRRRLLAFIAEQEQQQAAA